MSASPAPRLIACGREIDLTAPALMGIVNASPDSFSDGGGRRTLEELVARGVSLAEAGASIIDVGGESGMTRRPPVPVAEEMERVVPLVARIVEELGGAVSVSVDTYKPEVASAAIRAGARMVNDVSGLRNAQIAEVCASSGAALVIMHTRAPPKVRRQEAGLYGRPGVAADVAGFLTARMAVARENGVREEQLLLDPGPDFAKTPAQTVAALRGLEAVLDLGRPVLLALSRKDFIGAVLGRGPAGRGAGTLAALAWGVDAGGHVFRVHDVAAAADFLRVRAVLRGDVELPADTALPEELRRARTSDALPSLVPWSPAAEHNADGRPPTTSLLGGPMSSVLDPAELAASPLADLHLLANEIGVDGFRRMRKAELVDAILVAQGGEPAPPAPDIDATDIDATDVSGAPGGEDAVADSETDSDDDRPRRRSRGGRSRSRRATVETEEATAAGDEAEAVEEEDRPRRRSRGPRAARPEATDTPAPEPGPDKVVEGTIELMANGSAFIRVAPEAGGEDVYVSAAQVKRTELVSGDTVAGPIRPPRRSERHPSLIRVDSINGKPADEVSEGVRFEDLPATYPTERFELGSDDPTVKAVEWLTPFGRGSRVTVTGPSLAGKTEALVRLADALGAIEELDVSLVLAGTRPEELPVWAEHGLTPVGAALLGASPEAQAQVVEQAVERAKRQAARGTHAVLIIDSVEQLQLTAARRALGAARAITGGGSLTIIASAPLPVGGETTTIALDPALTALRRFPAVDLAASGTLRADLLVGEAGADAIAKARAEVLL